MKVIEIEGIGPAYAAKLEAAGVVTTDDLLEHGATTAGRHTLAEASGISHTLILEWVNHVDLMRISGVGPEYADLLEAAGVDSCAELAHRNAANLAITVQEVVAARPGIVRRTPGEAEIADWIAQAKDLPKVVMHGGGHADHGEHASAAAAAPATAEVQATEPAAEGPAPEPALAETTALAAETPAAEGPAPEPAPAAEKAPESAKAQAASSASAGGAPPAPPVIRSGIKPYVGPPLGGPAASGGEAGSGTTSGSATAAATAAPTAAPASAPASAPSAPSAPSTPSTPSPTAAKTAPAPRTATAPSSGTGLWARIKRMFGRG